MPALKDHLQQVEAIAVRRGDCRCWEPVDAVQACARDIESGVISVDKLYIAIEESGINGEKGALRFFCAGASRQELTALLEAHARKTSNARP